ncbi:unnamed protein product [Linum trigynum]|uniref:Cystatin domain-containing protein n=1 Tax=Linum trigynum TaxID=586398 RepID=A0AAV2EIA8_9ROSI
MDPNLTISSFDSDPEADASLILAGDESSPGSASSSSEAELGSEPKRQKVEEAAFAAADKSSDEVPGDDAGDSDEDEEEEEASDSMVWTQTPSTPVIWYPEDEIGRKKFDLFYEQIAASEGFDFDEVPPVDILEYGVLPVDMDDDDDGPKVRECVRFVIEQHNANNIGVSELVEDEIVKANYALVNGINYYITFKATDNLASDSEDATKVYQAEVYRRRNGVKQTTLFRVKGQREPIREVEDRPRTCM